VAERARALVVLLAVLAVVVTGCSGSAAFAPANTGAVRDARAFLDRYVAADGRVVRHDQGGDTVGEGQSYGLVLAQVAGDPEAFARIWGWTDAHLRRPDGLLAGRWADGAVADENSASDADLLTAWALLRADVRYRAAGEELAKTVLAKEVVALPAGPVLAAGQWATGQPATLNPSYWALGIMRDLAARTGDPQWTALADTAVPIVSELTGGATTLPPDWARVDAGRVSATPAPSGQVPDVRYSLDAQRVVVWFATARDPAARALAARWWTSLGDTSRSTPIALRLDATVLDPGAHPLPLVATAAAATAAGDTAARDRLLDRAGALDASRPGYYGSAWVALGLAFLTTDLLTVDPTGSPR